MTKKTKVLLNIFGTAALTTAVATSVTVSLTSCAENTSSGTNNSTPNDQTGENNNGNQPETPSVTPLQLSDVNTNLNFLVKDAGTPGGVLNVDNCVIKGGRVADKVDAPQGYSSKSGYRTSTTNGNPCVYLTLNTTEYKFFQIRLPQTANQLFKADSLKNNKWEPTTPISWKYSKGVAFNKIIDSNILSNPTEYSESKSYLTLTATMTSGSVTTSIDLQFIITTK